MSNTAIPTDGAVLRVIPGGQLERQIAERDRQDFQARQDAEQEAEEEPNHDKLAHLINTKFEQFNRHRSSASGWSQRLLDGLRTFNGKYDQQTLNEIKAFGGSQIYARVIAMKCRGASSLLRDIYLTPDRSWGINPPADPDIPDGIAQKVQELVMSEAQMMMEQGMDLPPSAMRDRIAQLMSAAKGAEQKQARRRAKAAQDQIEEILTTGGFYKAMAEFLVDLPIFPFAAIKGPVVKVVPTVKWEGGRAITKNEPRLFWNRVSPFDLWWTPGVSDIEDAEVIERSNITRAELNDLLDLPGYNQENLRKILDEYGRGGIQSFHDGTDSERAEYENRENPTQNNSGMITMLEYHGSVQGRTLIESHGFKPEDIEDPLRDYMVQAWMVGRYVIKVQLSPSPRKRHPYFITSFEKMPGTPVGNGLPDILEDIQQVTNATLRSLVNNLSISSGPQVVVNDDVLAPGEDGNSLYPWKRWHVQRDIGMQNASQKPVDFFQPQSNAQELLGIYSKMNEIADELSAIPRHMSGANPGGGAGRTASGLAMLMGNASKMLQTVAANIDRDVMEPALTGLYDMIMMTDEVGILQGDENIRVMGVNVAVQRETQRVRQLEFLNITANPIDSQIIGIRGRAAILRSVSNEIGLEGENIVPPDDEIAASMQEAQQAGLADGGAQAQGDREGGGANQDQGPRTNISGGPQ